MVKAHKIQVTVQNVSDEKTATAKATDWLRNYLPEVRVASVDAGVDGRETRVIFTLRLTEEEVSEIQGASEFVYLEEA